MPYKLHQLEVGILETQTVPSIKMRRARFVALVEETLNLDYYNARAHKLFPESEPGLYDRLRAKLIPVAETMVRFPLGTWLHSERGCGCVIGEYLVATAEIERAAVLHEYSKRHYEIDRLLAYDPDGCALEHFGAEIDRAIRREIAAKGLIGHVNAGYYSAADDSVQSVEIIG